MNIDLMEELSLITYTAISILERMGINPSQEQIDIMESVILMASYPKKIKPQAIAQCVGEDKLAYFFLCLKNKELCEEIHGNVY